jgi:hypothetical protein
MMYYTSKGGRARIGTIGTARIVGFAFLAVCTMAFASQSYGQGYVPLYHDKDRARVFCTTSTCAETAPFGLALADFVDSTSGGGIDGWLDVAVANKSHPGGFGSVSLFRNTQDWNPIDITKGLQFAQNPLLFNESARHVGFGLWGDIADALPSLVVATTSKVYIFYHNSLPGAPYGPNPSVVLNPAHVGFIRGMAVADLDGDGGDDIIVCGQDIIAVGPQLEVIWQRPLLPAGLHEQDVPLPASVINTGASDVVAGVIRLPQVQGRRDLAVTFDAGLQQFIVRCLNDGPSGNGAAWDVQEYPARPALSLAIGRFRPGGLADLVISDSVPGTHDAHVLFADSAGVYELPQLYDLEPGRDPFGVAVGHLNDGDAFLDFVAACQHGLPNYTHGGVAVFRGLANPRGTFNLAPSFFYVMDPNPVLDHRPKPCYVRVGDMNLDGKDDIVTANNGLDHGYSISVLLQIPYNDEQP